jgi:hypothetical protein
MLAVLKYSYPLGRDVTANRVRGFRADATVSMEQGKMFPSMRKEFCRRDTEYQINPTTKRRNAERRKEEAVAGPHLQQE